MKNASSSSLRYCWRHRISSRHSSFVGWSRVGLLDSCVNRRFLRRGSFVRQANAGFSWRDNQAFAERRAYATSAKIKHGFVCENCGTIHAKWHGFCNQCRQANSLKEFTNVVSSGSSGGGGGAGARAVEGVGLADRASANGGIVEFGKRMNRPYLGAKAELKPQRLAEITASKNHLHWRLSLPGKTGSEIARVLGGGLVPGSLILVSGDPGVGKSTLLLQLAEIVSVGADEAAPVLYISGEESVEQIGNRAERLKIESNEIFILSATDLDVVLTWIQEIVPRAVVLDSIQTVYLPDASGSAGSISQVRECTSALLRVAKKTNTAIFLIGHVTKSGEIAGPRTLEHMVDVCLHLEGDRLLSQRLLRSLKNRFGSTKEVGVFEMVDNGLRAVENPSLMFLSDRTGEDSNASATVGVALEGSRPLLVEIQALCSPATSLPSKRTFTGVDPSRFNLIVAVLLKQARLRLARQDIFVNVVGGFRLEEPATDIAVAVAIASSYIERPVPRDTVFVGELGLGGELRFVAQLERRLFEASKLGFKKCIVPQGAKGVKVDGMELILCSSLKDVLEKVFNYKSLPQQRKSGATVHLDAFPEEDGVCGEVQVGQDALDDDLANG
ncbi:uncharacterized protein LOC9649546 [Selaginella moellendorffii]|uniref:uncharacterized protein LOC9649546 n=1 Tax=Selaginella moellendorffii TaxID=88036 RepID=UPI000D1CF48E|nr:uncharacterized protein LOC9649546 [Selaginella moellendorffii]|eukprot:XP_024537421.1 uncharacterized protein LOC9649546 [Selaginella moellendorffii]